ncbi:MAG: type IX secretion system membrane protein PorP/SprF [Bacteroidales bacterium]|jgi:type IX secretion system PorP/SprF family membrane protein|nr:type IX secretion system membrane protein PorP/SprF [Bacteroidales bacterium]
MKILKKILFFSFIMLIWFAARSQQMPLYSQYMMNKFLINPAFAGSKGFTSFNLTARQQWLGFENAPMTQAISGQTRILKTSHISKSRSIRKRLKKRRPSGRVGIGGYMFNDRNGIVNRTGLQLTYAYHIFIKDGQLSFGVSGTGYQFSIDKSDIILHDVQSDPLVDGTKSTMYVPDANVGIYYSYNPFYVGVSANQLFQSALKFGSDNSFADYKMLREYNFMAGYRYDMENDFEIEPSLLIKTSENFNIQADINVKAYYKRDYWLGFSYRTGNAIITMVGVKVDKLYFGYAFDYSLSDIQKISYGSHEIMIGINLGDNSRRYRWLNRF